MIRAVARDAEPLTQSPHETVTRVFLVNIGIPTLQPQKAFRLPGGRFAIVDFYSDELQHVFEADGRQKYREQYDSRGRLLTSDDIVWMEKKREDLLRGLGLGMSRVFAFDTRPETLHRPTTASGPRSGLNMAVGCFCRGAPDRVRCESAEVDLAHVVRRDVRQTGRLHSLAGAAFHENGHRHDLRTRLS